MAQGVNNIVMTQWGLHIYYNIPSLVNKTGVDKRNSPWSLAENKASQKEYGKGTCPYADSLFERTILLAIPSNLKDADEQDIIDAFEKVLDQLPGVSLRIYPRRTIAHESMVRSADCGWHLISAGISHDNSNSLSHGI